MSNAFAPIDAPNLNGVQNRPKVAYFYDSDVGNYAYSAGHPMKPHRIRLAHSLIMNYGVYKKMEIYRAKPATRHEMTQFHTDEYVDFLQKVTSDNMDNYAKEQGKYNVGDDCPVFDGLFEFCGISAGGSMEGAARLNRGKCDIAVNWAGGLHHAKKSEASGFCYINDIVLGILELLRFKKRVLYIDIDVHHGDGVEEAFYTTDRVMTVSFHKYGEYFPGTGELRDIGVGPGKHYAVNFPLRDGITDESYKSIFEPVISSVMQYFQPEAVVLQCGGDSLSGDRLGCFNLSMRGHANCVKFVKSFGLPTLVVGGGGYTMRNVARTWAFETGLLVGEEMNPTLPYNEYYEYYGPDYELDVRPSNMENANSPEYLEKIKIQVIENLKKTAFVPSVQMQDVPRETLATTEEEEAALDDLDEDENKDRRTTQRQWDRRITHDAEIDESEDEDEDRANGIRSQPGKPKRRNIMDYQNPHAVPDIEMDSGIASEEQTNGDSSAAPAEEKAADTSESKSEQAPETTEATPAPPKADSPKAAVDGDGDVNMGEEEPAPAPAAEAETTTVTTPPMSPVSNGAAAAQSKSVPPETPAEPTIEPEKAPVVKEEAAEPTAGDAKNDVTMEDAKNDA